MTKFLYTVAPELTIRLDLVEGVSGIVPLLKEGDEVKTYKFSIHMTSRETFSPSCGQNAADLEALRAAHTRLIAALGKIALIVS